MKAEMRPVTVARTVEPWTEVYLDDGTCIKVRLNITDVHVLVAEDGTFPRDMHGKPQYSVLWAVATQVIEAKDEAAKDQTATETPHGGLN